MEVYFEAKLETSIDVFINFVPIAFILFLIFKFPVILQVASELVKISSNKLKLTVTAASAMFFLQMLMVFNRDTDLHSIMIDKRYLSVQGCISSYQVEKPKQGTRIESFKVNEILFSYESYSAAPYFINANFRDRYIKNDRCMEIHYINKDESNKILRIIKLPENMSVST